MEASALRWVLAIIGVIVIAGIYLYSLYQNRLRRRAAVKTLTHEELESGFIEDETLRKELSSINTMLDQELNNTEINEIKINPGLEAETKKQHARKKAVELPQCLKQIDQKNLIAHVLKRSDDQLLTGPELTHAFSHTGFELSEEHFFRLMDPPEAAFKLCNLSSSGSFEKISEEDFCSPGLVCYFDHSSCGQAQGCYELMLKKIDELVRLLDLKVYNQDLELLTIQHVTDIRTIIRGDS